jgi:tRNA(adenine34) deaminase
MEQKRRSKDYDYMELALQVAAEAKSRGDLPIAAVLAWTGGKQFVEHDTRYSEHNPLCHAIINLINKAADTMGRKKMSEATLYCNLEPNLLCALAIESAGIKEVVFGAYDDKDGFLSASLLREDTQLDITAIGGVLGRECCESLPQSMHEHVRYE